MNKSCQVEGCCQYKKIYGSIFECQYDGYCDYQLPKDSRMFLEEVIAQNYFADVKVISRAVRQHIKQVAESMKKTEFDIDIVGKSYDQALKDLVKKI